MLVSDLYNYLWNTFQANRRYSLFDQNETGGNSNLLVNAKVEILDGFGGSVLKTWSFDGITHAGDGTYDPHFHVTAPEELCIPDVMNDPADTIRFSNNIGSGKFDYLVYVPTMDLTAWADANNLFKVSWYFGDVDD